MDSLNLATEAVKVPRIMNPETIYVAPLSLVEVTVADAQKVKGLAPLACKTDRIDAWVLGRA